MDNGLRIIDDSRSETFRRGVRQTNPIGGRLAGPGAGRWSRQTKPIGGDSGPSHGDDDGVRLDPGGPIAGSAPMHPDGPARIMVRRHKKAGRCNIT